MQAKGGRWVLLAALAVGACSERFGAADRDTPTPTPPPAPVYSAEAGSASSSPIDAGDSGSDGWWDGSTEEPEGGAAPVPLFPTNGDPARQIRFSTEPEAAARRDLLVHFIWDAGLPGDVAPVVKNVALPSSLSAIAIGDIAGVDQIDVELDSGLRARAFAIRPTSSANRDRLILVHQGHAHTFIGGVDKVAAHLVHAGFTVLVLMMPLYGWNVEWGADGGIILPPQFRTHDAFFAVAADAGAKDGRALRYFLDPAVRALNTALAEYGSPRDVTMIGLSGGAWTTTVMAALDPRITYSVPVAGSAPLYVRNIDRRSIGDTEQFLVPLYDEAIALDGTGGGIATWLEIYALGAMEAGRRQIQVTNEFDPCCFRGLFADSYASLVGAKVTQLGGGGWEHFLDSTHTQHQISDHAIETVLDPLLGIGGDAGP